MKTLTILTASLIGLTAQAQDICSSVSQSAKFQKAVEAVAQAYDMTLAQLCSSERFLGVEAQPSRVISREGEVIPHVRVQLHGFSSSCLYMVRDSDLSITSSKCYSGE